MNIDESLTILFSDHYRRTKYIPDTQVAKIILLPIYEKFVSEGLKPIENLSVEEKISLTEECRKTGERYTNRTLIEQCKILYLIKNVTKVNA